MRDLTENEILVICNLACNEMSMNNGSYPEEYSSDMVTADDSINCGPVPLLSESSVPGVFGSLVKKGLAWTEDGVCSLTEEGYEEFTSRFKSIEDVMKLNELSAYDRHTVAFYTGEEL